MKLSSWIGILLILFARFNYNELIGIDEHLYDFTFYLGLIIFLLERNDITSIILSFFISAFIFDEIIRDSGEVTVLDYIEVIITIASAYIKIKYINKNG